MMSQFKRSWNIPLFASLLLSTPSFAESYQLNLHKGVTPISHDLYSLHMLIFWICVAIGVVVFGVMFYSIFKFRKSKGAVAATFHEHTLLEIVWAIIPFFILVAMAIPATKVLIRMFDYKDASLTVKVTGYQWKWEYDYLDLGIHYFSNLSTPQDEIVNKAPKGKWYLLQVDKPLVVPIHQKIRFLFTSSDVIHSWWVPKLGVKKDALPGFITESWTRINKPGTYRGQCTELCGMHHGFMPIVVVAKTEADFKTWVKEQKEGKSANTGQSLRNNLSMDELMKLGKEKYDASCGVCHKPDGSGMPPTFPALKKSPIIMGPISKHIDVILNGIPGTGMQAFGSQLTDSDIAAITTYERNAWGNDRGDMAQPLNVYNLRHGKALNAAAPVADKPANHKATADKAASATAAATATKTGTAAATTSNATMTHAELMALGKTTYDKACAVCHKPNGSGMPPVFPSLLKSKAIIGPIDQHVKIVLNGVPGTAMQAFSKQLSNAEIAAVVTYERNAWGNNQGDRVQASDVETLKQK